MAKYSIILPVRNGGEYVRECVNSILTQSLNNFNLLVLDNASTDGTPEWIRSLNDSRIEIFPTQKSLTIEENWSRALTVPANEFITLIGHDDILYKDYLLVMDALIAKHPQASLYQTHFSFIDSKGAQIRKCKPMDEVQNAQAFAASFLANIIDIMGTGFMMRFEDYKAVGGIPPQYPNLLFADFELWLSLTLKGYKATASEECFAFRKHLSVTSTSSDLKMKMAFFIFISYLKKLKATNHLFDEVINTHGIEFIRIYSKGLAHRLLRTPYSKRNGETVKSFIAQCKKAADELVPGNQFQPNGQLSVRVAEWIDTNPLTRGLFLLFKKIYSKPVYS